jgi:hypothetical protein
MLITKLMPLLFWLYIMSIGFIIIFGLLKAFGINIKMIFSFFPLLFFIIFFIFVIIIDMFRIKRNKKIQNV